MKKPGSILYPQSVRPNYTCPLGFEVVLTFERKRGRGSKKKKEKQENQEGGRAC